MINSEKFLELRKGRDMKVEHLAFDLGVSISAIWNVENDPNHNPSSKVISKYAKYFNIKIEELVDVENTQLGKH